jgi:serine/threonine protein kinase
MNNENVKEFVREGRLLQRYDHKNIVKFIGIAIDEKPIYILMEFINGGSCSSFLQRNNSINKLSTHRKLKLCEDCAEGKRCRVY